MAGTEINTFDDIAHLMTEEERQAFKELKDEGFETLSDDDVFDAEEVRAARLSQIEREKEEAEKDGDFVTQEEDDAAKAAADAEAKPEPKDEGKAAPEGEAKAEGEAEAAPEGEPAKAEAEAEPAPVTEAPKPAPMPSQEVLEKAMASADATIEARIAELTQKLDDVEITSEQFKAAVAEANAARRTLVANAVADINFQQTTADYLNQYPELRTQQHVEGLNAEFEMIDNSPVFAKLSDADKLALAHERYNNTLTVAKSRGLAVPEPVPLKGAAAPAPKADPAPADMPAPKPALAAKPQPPKTLAKMPASDAAAPGEGRATQLRQLVDSNDPDAIQEALLNGSISTRDLENM